MVVSGLPLRNGEKVQKQCFSGREAEDGETSQSDLAVLFVASVMVVIVMVTAQEPLPNPRHQATTHKLIKCYSWGDQLTQRALTLISALVVFWQMPTPVISPKIFPKASPNPKASISAELNLIRVFMLITVGLIWHSLARCSETPNSRNRTAGSRSSCLEDLVFFSNFTTSMKMTGSHL